MARSVMLGEREVPLPRFSVFKATEAIGLVSEIMAAYPELVERVADYQDRHAVQVPVLENGELVKDDDGQTATRTVPGDLNEALAHVFPDAYRLARGKVLDLLALIVTRNEDLQEADLAGKSIHRNGGPEWATVEGYKAIAHGAEVQQLGRLLIAAKDMLKEQLEDADPQTRQAVDMIVARLPKITLTGPSQDDSEPGSSPDSAQPSPGSDEPTSSTTSRGAKRSTSAGSSGKTKPSSSTK